MFNNTHNTHNTHSDHPLIQRQQTYMLDRKLVSVSSQDRDQCSWCSRANFEITLPQQLLNVETIRLVECNFPSNNYTFKNSYYNTQFLFKIPSWTNYLMLTINEGFYTPTQIASELTNKLNYYTAIHVPGYNHFIVVYNEVTQKLQFGNNLEPFELNFDAKISYNVACAQPTTPVCQNGKWGLPYYLGFEKKIYSSSRIDDTQSTPLVVTQLAVPPAVSGGEFFNNLTYLNIADADYYWLGNGSVPYPYYFCNAPNQIKVIGETNIYMELDKCNQADELKPYPLNTNGTINNTYNGIVNSFFAKIPILVGCPNMQYFDSRNGLIQNLTTFFPPLERLGKIKVKFRYHDGTLVDFSNDFSFTLAFDCYRDEMARTLLLRTPAQYRL